MTQQLISMHNLSEANTIINFLADYVDQVDFINQTHISSFELLDSVYADKWCQATVYFKLEGCPIPFTVDLPYLTPEMLVQLCFAADPMDCKDRREAREFFVQHYLTLFLTILYTEADRVIKLARTQMN